MHSGGLIRTALCVENEGQNESYEKEKRRRSRIFQSALEYCGLSCELSCELS